MHGKARSTVLGVAVVAILAAVVWLVWSRSAGMVDAPTPDIVDDPRTPTARTTEVADSPPDEGARTPAEVDPSTAGTPAPVEPPPEQLWGRVVAAADGAPIPGADVRLQHRDADEFWNLDLAYGAQVDELDRTVSDVDGRFRFDVTRAREHRIHVHARGYAPNTVVDCTGGSMVIVELCRGATIEGIVRSGGEPMVDVPVQIAVVGQSIELASGRTGADGAFRFTGLQPFMVFVQVCSADHSEEWKRVRLEEGGLHRVEIDVPVGEHLTGSVRDASTGAPVVGAEITDSWTFDRVVRTDVAGNFTLRGLGDEGFVEVHVRAEGYASASRNLTGELDESVVFSLVQGGEVTGRFVDPDGSPPRQVYAAVGASYMAGPGMGSTDWIRARIDGNGLFVARGLRPDQHYWLYVRGRGYGTRVYVLSRRLESGERIDVGDVVLRPAGGVEGKVVDEHGAPIAGIRVSIAGTNTDSGAWFEGAFRGERVLQFESRSLKTDARGRFRFTNLSAGQHQLSVRPRGQSRAISQQVETQDGVVVEGIQITVPTGAVIEGTLHYADGRALGDEASELWLVATPRGGGNDTNARIQSNGHFRFEGLDEGVYDIAMMRGPEGWTLPPRRDVQTGTEDLQLALQPAAKLEGRVVDADGNGVRARVWIRRAEGGPSASPLHGTDDDGHFEIEVPPDFRGSIHARDPESMMVQASLDNVAAGQSGLELRLK